MYVLVESGYSLNGTELRHRRTHSVLLNQGAKLSLPLEEPYMHGVTKGVRKRSSGVAGHFPQQLLVDQVGHSSNASGLAVIVCSNK